MVIVNVFEGPVHVSPLPASRGVTVTVATTGVVPALTAVNEPIVPVPLEASPIEDVLFAQL